MIRAASNSGRVLPAVWKLLLLRARLSLNTFRHARLIAKILRVVGVLALVALAIGIVYVSQLILGLIRSPAISRYFAGDTSQVLASLPVLLLTALFFGIIFTSFGVLLQALYLTGDMDFLLAAPVPIRAVFITKLIQAILPNFGFSMLFGLPILYGLGISAGYSLIYYPLVLVVMAALALAAAGLSSLLVMGVVRLLPPRRAAEILGFVGATAGVICAQTGNLSHSFGRDLGLSGERLDGLVTTATQIARLQLPLNWAGQGLVAIGRAQWLPGFALIALTLLSAGLVFWFALVTAERLYYTGWAGMQVVAQRSKVRVPARAASAPSRDLGWASRLLPGPIRGILAKDFLLLRRDLRNLSQLISPAIIGIVITLSLLRSGRDIPTDGGDGPAWVMQDIRLLLAYTSVAVALFVGWILLGRLAGMSFSQEGRSYWILKASPASVRQLLTAKFLVAYLPTTVLASCFLLAISFLQATGPGQLVYMFAMLALCLAGANGLLLAFGAAGANLHWSDPRRMNAGGLGCLGQILTAVFLPVAVVLFIGPLFAAPLLHVPQAYGYLAGILLGAVACLLAMVLPLRIVERRVKLLDES